MSRRLIEEWLPIAELGIESVRERTPMTPYPAPNRLHVWWARRPLVASRAAIMGSLLPADADRDRFMHMLGIHGDPVATKAKLDLAKRTGENLGLNPYGYARAFSYSPSDDEKEWFAFESTRTGVTNRRILDPTAGGGSIPLEGIRVGANVLANDLNPVASFVEKMTLDSPLFCNQVVEKFIILSKEFIAKAEPKFKGIYPEEENNNRVDGYLFARTIRCPYCGGLIPLSPNWRLAPDGTGVHLEPNDVEEPSERKCDVRIVHKASEQSDATVTGGRAICPFPSCGRVIDGDQVKAIAQNQGMGEQLFAVVIKKRVTTTTKTGKTKEKWERDYRAPRPEDDVFDDIKAKLEEKLPEWEAMDIVPTEVIPDGLKTSEPIRYGAKLWRDLFSPRQLYSHCTSVEVFRELLAEEQAKPGFGEAEKAAFGYLALAIDTVLNYGTRSCRWDTATLRVRSIFDRHDFAFVWSYSEMATCISGLGYDWALDKTEKCLVELIEMLRPDIDAAELKGNTSRRKRGDLLSPPAVRVQYTPPKITLSCGNGSELYDIDDHSIDAVVMDPPYYDNVMYAELSDFFYVWLKRTAGYVYPELFTRMLTDKENEAVANPAKYKDQKGAKVLASRDYQERMAAIFAECKRVLTDDGVLMLMFTHKATGAWDALTKGLLNAGFMITASWPVNTEAEGSLHIKDKAAANSTIFLVCRPRPAKNDDDIVFWEDLEPMVRKEVLRRVDSFRQSGIGGIDLYLACFGPALEVFSKHWPVQRGTPKPVKPIRKPTQSSLLEEPENPYATTPDDVLLVARDAVKTWSLQQIMHVERKTNLDALMEWFVLAWHTFKSPQFPYDEALNLARVVGVDMDKDIIGVIAEKKASDVIIWDSEQRAAKAALGPSSGSRSMLDALHHTAHSARLHSLDYARDALVQNGLIKDRDFLDALSAALEVLPVSRKYTGYDIIKAAEPSAADFEILENLRHLALNDVVPKPKQLSLFGDA